MELTEVQRQMIAEFPEIKKVLPLRDCGFQFWFIVQVLVGVREWPGGWMDHFHLRTDTDCWAARATHDDELVWERSGGLAEVVDALFELPAPGQPHAPKLVRAAAPLRLIVGKRAV